MPGTRPTRGNFAQYLLPFRRHVFRDIHPYICTFPDCTTPQRLFSRRREWFLHELEMHRCHWQCAHGCWGDFKTACQFEDHVAASHPESTSPEDLAKLSSASVRPMSQWSLVNCSMCGEKDISLQKLKRHLGRHQEDLALFAMPFTGYELEENATEETGSFEANASVKSGDSISSSLFGHEDDRQEKVTTFNATNDDHKHFREGEDGDRESEVEGNEFVLADPRHSDIRPVPLTSENVATFVEVTPTAGGFSSHSKALPAKRLACPYSKKLPQIDPIASACTHVWSSVTRIK